MGRAKTYGGREPKVNLGVLPLPAAFFSTSELYHLSP